MIFSWAAKVGTGNLRPKISGILTISRKRDHEKGFQSMAARQPFPGIPLNGFAAFAKRRVGPTLLRRYDMGMAGTTLNSLHFLISEFS